MLQTARVYLILEMKKCVKKEQEMQPLEIRLKDCTQVSHLLSGLERVVGGQHIVGCQE